MTILQPRVSRWVQKHETVSNVDKLSSIPRTLDRLRPSEVTWDPYSDIRISDIVLPMAFYSGCLKYMEVVEPYHSERFLRQLGHVQGIPPSPYHPFEANRGRIAMKYSVKYSFQPKNWERWHSHSLSVEDRGEKARFKFMAAPEYLPWFTRVSHPTIKNQMHNDDFLDMVGDNELLERNRQVLDSVLAWIDLPAGMTKMEAAEKTANDVVDYLTGRGLSTGTTTTTTTNATTPSAPTALSFKDDKYPQPKVCLP
ncbi:hypothetical protein Sjap_012924 [Stephania japonica]|uniref:Aminotransferase-like plant mobile domain-containing protein n=1 Tax=Stephania japonica TaxID=461633 RepID=A0AAP0NX88_9MAGN